MNFTRSICSWIHLLRHLIRFSGVILDEAKTSHTSETVVRGVHDGINLENRNIALPVEFPQSYSEFWTRLLIGVTNHNDTRSRRAGLRGYLGDFTALSTPPSYNSWRVLIEASLRVISSSESDIFLWILRRASSREKRRREKLRGLPPSLQPGCCSHSQS